MTTMQYEIPATAMDYLILQIPTYITADKKYKIFNVVRTLVSSDCWMIQVTCMNGFKYVIYNEFVVKKSAHENFIEDSIRTNIIEHPDTFVDTFPDFTLYMNNMYIVTVNTVCNMDTSKKDYKLKVHMSNGYYATLHFDNHPISDVLHTLYNAIKQHKLLIRKYTRKGYNTKEKYNTNIGDSGRETYKAALKRIPNTVIVNCTPTLITYLETGGFDEIIDINKELKTVTLDIVKCGKVQKQYKILNQGEIRYKKSHPSNKLYTYQIYNSCNDD
jgi:hypothetical protein